MRALTLVIFLALASSGCDRNRGVDCRSNGIETCSCVAESLFANDTACGPAADAPSVCCAEPTWPGAGSCVCRSFYCLADAVEDGGVVSACHCRSQDPGNATQVTQCTGWAPDGGAVHCCLVATAPGPTGYQCTCSEAECGSTATEVTDCTAAALATSTWCDLLAPTVASDAGLYLPGAAVVSTCR